MRTLIIFILVFTSLESLVLSGPTQGSTPKQCSTYCTESKLLRLEVGSRYEYSYSGWAETSLAIHSPRKEDHDPGLLLNATVFLTALAPCEIQLEMSDIYISGGGGNSYVAELAREPIRASLQAGRMETLCVAGTSSSFLQRWALNVKRGVLGALQVSLRSTPERTDNVTIHETDVSGTCRTQYEYLTTDGSTILTRRKDLSLCSNRASNTWNLNNEQTSRPLIRGDQECLQTLKDGHVSMVRCRETHVFQPFSNGDHGAASRIEQVLILENIVPGKARKPPGLPEPYRRTSLMYEHGLDSEEVADKAFETITTLLKEMSGTDIQQDSARKFSQLVRYMRALSKDELITLLTAQHHEGYAREVLLDALPILDTAAGTSAMVTLYEERLHQSHQLRQWLEHRAASWFATLSSSRRPNTEMLQATQALLRDFEDGRLSHTDATGVVLGVSGLTHALCEKLGGVTQCISDPAVRSTVNVLETVLNAQDHKTRILALKALGNIGIFLDSQQLVYNYIQNSSLSAELRVVAMDAFRRTPCPSPKVTSPFLKVYTDVAEDSEIRIAAYLAAMRCPSPALLRSVKQTLYSETVNQVGSFVWTHLTNSQESQSKSRATLRALLSNDFLQNKFRTDARQFSRNYEASRYFETLGVGVNSDANVVFSTKSYLPRSAMLNLTVDLFGESVNLLEIGGRAEGMEPLLERLFSKQGKFENEAISELLRNARSDPTLNSVLNKTNSLKQIITPKASVYLRLFGTEISYKELADIFETSYQFDVNPSLIIKSLLTRKEQEFSKSFEVINTKQEFPTAIGLPLTLSVNGTASVKVAMKVNFETTKSGIELSGKFTPSANLAITGTMSVGNADFEQGLKFEAAMYTNTNFDSKLKYSHEGKINFQSEMPAEKQTLIEMKSERFIFNGDKITNLPDLTPQRESYSECTGDFVHEWFGVKLCSEMTYPNASLVQTAPYFPLTGDSYLNVTIVKSDPTFKAYDFSTSWIYKPGFKYDFGISYDRLGSNLENKRRALQFVFDRMAGIARLTWMTLDQPHSPMEVLASWDSKDLSAGEIKLNIDGHTYYQVLASIPHQAKILQGGISAGKYEPHFLVSIKDRDDFNVAGVINYVGNSKVSAEFRMTGATEKPVSFAVDASRDYDTGAIDARLMVDSPWITWDVKGGAKLTTNSLGLKIGGNYNRSEANQHTLDLLAKYNWNIQGALRRDYLNLRAQLSQWPDVSGQITAEVMTSRGYYESSVRLLFAERQWNISQRAQSSGGGDVWLSTVVQCPQRNIDFRAEHRHKLKENSFSTTTRLHVDPSRHSSFHLDYKHIPGDGLSFSTDSSLIWPGITFSDGNGPYLESRLRQILPGQYIAHLATQWSEQRSPVIINATYSDRSTLRKIKYGIDAKLTGAMGFTTSTPLLLKGKMYAESGMAVANASLSYGENEQVNLQISYELEMQEKHKLNVSMLLWGSKKYEVITTLLNTENDKDVSLDIIMSRHLAFNFKVQPGMLHTSVFWDKRTHPEHNVTLIIDVSFEETTSVAGVLIFPGQRLGLEGVLEPFSALQLKNNKSVLVKGYEARGGISWLPDREVTLSCYLRGSLESGAQGHVELTTRGVPVLGRSRRRLDVTYIPGTPSQAKVYFLWGEEGQHNISCEVEFQRNKGHLSAQLSATSSLWSGKHAKARLTHESGAIGTYSGGISGHWGSKGGSINWDFQLGSLAKFDLMSTWDQMPSLGAEFRVTEWNENQVVVKKHLLKLYYEDQNWEAALSHAQTAQEFQSVELKLMTPLPEYRHHKLNITLNGAYPRNIKLNILLNTPLLGDYSMEAYYSATYDLLFGMHLLNFDTTLLKLNTVLQRDISYYKGGSIDLLMPEICNVKTSLLFDKQATGLITTFSFENNKKVLHDITLMYKHIHYNDSSVLFEAKFSGYSYLILTSKWEAELRHAGTHNFHTSNLRVNEFNLAHEFIYEDKGEWIFIVLGKTSQELINITLQHDDSTRLNYYIQAMGTEVVNVRANIDIGFAFLDFMDNILQIHSRFKNEDGLETQTKVIVDSKLYATVLSNSFIRYNEENIFESLIFTGDVLSGSNLLKINLNMDSTRLATAKLVANYEDHNINAAFNIFQSNNTFSFSYSKQYASIVKLDTFLYIDEMAGNLGLVAAYKNYDISFYGNLKCDHDQNIVVYAKIDGQMGQRGVFPITLNGKISISEMKIDLSIFDVNKSGVAVSGQLKFEPYSKAIKIEGTMPGFNDEFVKIFGNYESQFGHELQISYEKKRFKYQGEFSMSDDLITAKIKTPLEGYKDLSMKIGMLSNKPKQVVMEFAKEKYRFNAEIIFTGENSMDSNIVIVAKSSEGMEFDASFTKHRRQKSTDCALIVQMNGEKIEVGALLEFLPGNLNITTNVTRSGDTARMKADIRRTDSMKSFTINSNFKNSNYYLNIYSAADEKKESYQQGFKVKTQSFNSEFKYEKNSQISLAFLSFQNQVIQCILNGTTKNGDLLISQKTLTSFSNLHVIFDFDNKIDATITAIFNETLRDNMPLTLAYSEPLNTKILYNPAKGKAQLSLNYKNISYLAEGSYIETELGSNINIALETPFMDKALFNISYKFEENIMNGLLHFDYGSDFYDMEIKTLVYSIANVSIDINCKSSITNLDQFVLNGYFLHDDDVYLNLKVSMPSWFYIVTLKVENNDDLTAKIKTTKKELELKYRKNNDERFISVTVDQKKYIDAIITLKEGTMHGTIITPNEKYQNLTVFLTHSSNIPSKSLEIHRNQELILKAHTYVVENVELPTGTGIMAVIYQGQDKLVYDTQFSLNNPSYIIVRQRENSSNTRDILNLKFSVADETTASGEASFSLPISPYSKIMAKGSINIEKNNAEFKVTYKIDNEPEQNFVINYQTFIDHYNIYNVVCNITTPFNGYDSISLKVKSSLTETIMNFASPFIGYEDITIVAVHRIEGAKKILQVQYQNLKKRIFYVKVHFNNEPNDKLLDLEARSPFLNGQAMIYGNYSLMGIKIEHEHAILTEVYSKILQSENYLFYEFYFRNTDKIFNFSASYTKEQTLEFNVIATLNEKTLTELELGITNSGHLTARLVILDEEYLTSGDVDWHEKAIQLSITGSKLKTEISFIIKNNGILKINSNLLLNQFIMFWDIQTNGCNFNVTAGPSLNIVFSTSKSHINALFSTNNHEYSIIFGQVLKTGWPNIQLELIWDSSPIIDFQHQYLTDNEVTLVRTHLISPFLGNHKTMKFEVSLVTKDGVTVEAQFKWRPKDFTLFKSQLKLKSYNSLASIEFKSPFSTNFQFNAIYDFAKEKKTVEVFYSLSETLQLQITLIPDGAEKILNATLVTSLNENKPMSIIGTHSVIRKKHAVMLKLKLNSDEILMQLNVDNSDLKATLSMPNSRWVLTGNYDFNEAVHSINSVFQWGGVADVSKLELLYSPYKKILINVMTPSRNYKIDYKLDWNEEKKGFDMLLMIGEVSAEFNFQIAIRDNLYLLVSLLKCPWIDFVRVSSVFDSMTQELRGALQINETPYALHAIQVESGKYSIVMKADNERILQYDVFLQKSFLEGLEITIQPSSKDFDGVYINGFIHISNSSKVITTKMIWGIDSQNKIDIKLSKEIVGTTKIQINLDTPQNPNLAAAIEYKSKNIFLHLKNQSESLKLQLSYDLSSIYSVNTTTQYNNEEYVANVFFDPNDFTANLELSLPQNKIYFFSVSSKADSFDLSLATPYSHFNNIKLSGKYAEYHSRDMYEIVSSAETEWNAYSIGLNGVIRNNSDTYGLSGSLSWGDESTIQVSCDVIQNKKFIFNLKTPLKVISELHANFETIAHRGSYSGFKGEINTPFTNLPNVNFTFNRKENMILAKFNFDTSTYKNISIHTEFSTNSYHRLYLHMNTPFLNNIKHLGLDAKTIVLANRGLQTSIFVLMEDDIYEIRNNYSIINGKLDSYVYMSGPSSTVIEFKFGGKFIMQSFTDVIIETYLNENIVELKYNFSLNSNIYSKIYIPSYHLFSELFEFDSQLLRKEIYELRVNYIYGKHIGNTLFKNKLTNNSLQIILNLNLPNVLKYPLQINIDAYYDQPHLQISGYASYRAEHKLDLTMDQNSFRTTLDAHLNSAFFKDTKKFGLSLTTNSLTVSMNDEIKVTGVKKRNQLELTLSQINKHQDHTLTYMWELINIPKFEVTLESPMLTAKKATFTALYLGLNQGINLQLVSGTESLRLDYGLINQRLSKGVKVLIGNGQQRVLDFAATIVKLDNGHELLADINILELNYKIVLSYILPGSLKNDVLSASLKLYTPYMFPMKSLNAEIKAGHVENKYTFAANLLVDEESIVIKSEINNGSLIIELVSSVDYALSGTLNANYKLIEDRHIVDGKLTINNFILLEGNATMIKRTHSDIFECHLSTKLEAFDQLHLKLTLPSDLKYSLTANIEVITSDPFKAYFILTSRPAYTNLDLVMTGHSVNIHLTSNQGDFTYKSGSDDYHMRIYSKSTGHELHSELTVNSGSIELFKAGLYGMYHNHSDFYTLMSATSVYEPIQNVVFYIGAEKSQIRFGAEYEGNTQPTKLSYTATINYHVIDFTDFDIGISIEDASKEMFMTKVTHTCKPDFYIALVQVNKSIAKITKIYQDNVMLGTASAKHGSFSTDISIRLLSDTTSKGLDVKLTLENILYHVGGLYNYSGEYLRAAFDLDSPYTYQNSINFAIEQPDILLLSVNHNQSSLILIDIHHMNPQNKYLLVNFTHTKLLHIEQQNETDYEITTSVLYNEQTYRSSIQVIRDLQYIGSYKCNVSFFAPSRSVGFYHDLRLTENKNSSQFYVAWESLDKRVGYSYIIFKDNFKTNLEISLELPNRVLQFKSHKKNMVIDSDLTDLEYGVQFNWNSKIYKIPITLVTSIKYNSNVMYIYSVATHPSFENTIVFDGEIRMLNFKETHFATQIGLLKDGKMSPILIAAVNKTADEFSRNYRLLLIHTDSRLHQIWVLKTDTTRGFFSKISLADGTNNRHAVAAVDFVSEKNKIDMSFSCQELEVKLAAQLDMDRKNKRYGVVVSGSYDPLADPLSISATFERLDAERLRLTAELSVAAHRSYLAEARYSPRDVSAYVQHREYTAILETAMQASVTLNNSEVLSVRARYSPELWANITEDLIIPSQRSALVLNILRDKVEEMVREEILMRLNIMRHSASVSTVFNEIMDHTRLQWSSLRQDLSAVRNIVSRIYTKDEFYVRTIWEFTVGAFWQGKQMLSGGVARLQEAARSLFTRIIPEFARTVYEATLEPLVQGLQKLAPGVTRFVRRLTETWRKIKNAISNAYISAVVYASDASVKITKYTSDNLVTLCKWTNDTKDLIMTNYIEPWKRTAFELAQATEEFFTEVNDFVTSLPIEVERYLMSLEEVQAAISLYKQYANWLEEINFTELVISLRDTVRSWYARLIDDVREQLGDHFHYVTMVLDAMQCRYEEINTLPQVIYAKKVINQIDRKTAWLWEYWRVESTIEHLMIVISDEIVSMLMTWSDETIQDYRKNSIFSNNESNGFFSYDPQKGDFSAMVPLPFKWHRFDQTPELEEKLDEKFEKFRYAVVDHLYNLASQSSDWRDVMYRTILPPFSSSAIVTASGHVISLDGQHYKIKEHLCGSYLLSADYHENSFSVVLNYGESGTSGPLRSLTLHTNEGQRIEMSLDLEARQREDEDGFTRVTLNNNKVELPLNAGSFRVRREGQLAVAEGDNGVVLQCNVVAGLCTLELPGWYHGKVAGLAGSLDRELGNDVASLVGNTALSVSDFLKQWKVSQGAACGGSHLSVKPRKVRSTGVCRQLFQSSDSPLQPCFRRLDPAPFRAMCDQDMASTPTPNRPDGDNTRGPQCLAAEAYVEQCKFVGMELSMPQACVSCRLPGGRVLGAGDVVIYDGAPESRLPAPPSVADVVFVMERSTPEEACSEGRELAELPAKLESVMRASLGITSTRFALVTFGAGRQPDIHTQEGAVWGTRRSLQHALTNLEVDDTLTKTSDSDLLSSLLTTLSRLSFRAGASKSVILAPCSSCSRSDNTANIFAEASSMLLEADVRLHVLQKQEMAFKKLKKRQPVNQGSVNPVMGIDTHGAYTGRRIKGTSTPHPSKAILRQLSIPKDLCTPLALETNGTVFSMSKLTSQNGDAKRKWLDVWSRRVASSATPTPCQTCDCLPYTDGSSRVTCQPCVSPSIQYFLQEWEDFLEAASQDDLGDPSEGEESGEEVVANTKETEDERKVLNRIRDMLSNGKAIPDGF